MALKVKDELVGKRFIYVDKSSSDFLRNDGETTIFEIGKATDENFPWKRGIIRAISSKDINEESHQILVEYDNEPWVKREWLTTIEQVCLLMVEDSLVWIRDKCINKKSKLTTIEGSMTDTPSYIPAITFRRFYSDPHIGKVLVVEILQNRKLLFDIDPTSLLPFKEADLKLELPLCQDDSLLEEVKKWVDVQNGQNILLNMPLILVGFRVQVYRTEGTTQWFTAVIRMVDEDSQTLVILDDTVLEEHHVSPSLVQMSLIGEGVVSSILNGDHVKIRPSRRRNIQNTPTIVGSAERKRKAVQDKNDIKKHTTGPSPPFCPKINSINNHTLEEEASKKQTCTSTKPNKIYKYKSSSIKADAFSPIAERVTCFKGEIPNRSLFKPRVKQKLSSSSSSSSLTSSSSSDLGDAIKEKQTDLNNLKRFPNNKRTDQNGVKCPNLNQTNQLIDVSLISNLVSIKKSCVGIQKQNKKNREKKGVIFLTEEEEEEEKFIKSPQTCLVLPEQNNKLDLAIQEPKHSLKEKNTNHTKSQLSYRDFVSMALSGNKNSIPKSVFSVESSGDCPVDLSLSVSSNGTNFFPSKCGNLADRFSANLPNCMVSLPSGITLKADEAFLSRTTFVTSASAHHKNNTPVNHSFAFGPDKTLSLSSSNVLHPLPSTHINHPTGGNAMQFGYFPFLSISNNAPKSFLQTSEAQKNRAVPLLACSSGQVATLAENIRLMQQLQAGREDNAAQHCHFARNLLKTSNVGQIEQRTKDESHSKTERREKSIVHEPEKPGDAVNLHFNKSLTQVRLSSNSQSPYLPGVMIAMPSQITCTSNQSKNAVMPNVQTPSLSNSQLNMHNLLRGSPSIVQQKSDTPIQSVPKAVVAKPVACVHQSSNSNVASVSGTGEPLKPTLDLSGNVYLSNDVMFMKLKHDQLQDYFKKIHVPQFQQLKQANHPVSHNNNYNGCQSVSTSLPQQRIVLPVGHNSHEISSSAPFILLPNKLLGAASSTSSPVLDPLYQSAVLDLQKKQNFSTTMISTSRKIPTALLSKPEKVKASEQQTFISNPIIVLDCHTLKSLEPSLVNQFSPSSSFTTFSSSQSQGTDASVDNKSISSNQLHTYEVALSNQNKKRLSDEALPNFGTKKSKLTEEFTSMADVTSLLFCGSDRKINSPQLGLSPYNSLLPPPPRLQACYRAATPDEPTIPNLIKIVRQENTSVVGSTLGIHDQTVKREFIKLEEMKTSGSHVFHKEASEISSLPRRCPTSLSIVSDGFEKEEKLAVPAGGGIVTTSLLASSSQSSLKSISSPESSRENANEADSDTRSACSPSVARSSSTPSSTSDAGNKSFPPSLVSSSRPVKFKKAWLKRYDDDSRNDVYTDQNVQHNSNEIGSKSVEISFTDSVTSAVEDSSDAWTSEQDMDCSGDENKVCMNQSHPAENRSEDLGKGTQNKCENGQFKKNKCKKEGLPPQSSELKTDTLTMIGQQYECLEKMKGRLRELRVASKRDDPSAILSSQVMNNTSREKRCETLEPFLQDGSCHEVTPRVIKCRECKAIRNKKDRKAPNDFCRFYAFRRLRYISKRHLSVSGFSDLSDVTVPDMELWFPTLPIVGPPLDVQVASYLLDHLHKPFLKLINMERMAEKWCLKSIDADHPTTVWKRAVQGVKEMCDVCDAALFNIHCVCNKCGFAVCTSCHSEKVFQMGKTKSCENGGDNLSNERKINDISFKSDVGKLKKTKGSKLPGDANSIKEENTTSDGWLTCHNKQHLHDPLKLMIAHTIPSDVLWYTGDLLQKYLLSRATSTPDSVDVQKSSTCLGQGFDRLAVLADVAEKQMQQDGKSNEDDPSGKSCFSFVNKKKSQRENVSSFLNGSKFPGKSAALLQNGKLLHMTDACLVSSNHLLDSFQIHWSRGLPVVTSKCNLEVDLWRPDLLQRTLSRLDPHHVESFADAAACRKFWEGFEKVSVRLKNNQFGLVNSDCKFSPVYTWGSTRDEFRDILPSQYQNLIKSLPVLPYTSDFGQYNLAARLPDFFAKPDLGPRLHVGYGQLNSLQGSVPMKLEGCDVVTLLACVVTPKDDVNNHLSAAEKYLLKIGCGLKLSDTATKPGAVWHVFERKCNSTIEKIMNEKLSTKKMPIEENSIGSSSVYLNIEDLKQLKRDHDIEPITIVQHLDDAVFIPAGCYHQVRFLHGCVMVSMDIVTPENTEYMLDHQLKTSATRGDKLQLMNTIYHAIKDALAVTMQKEMLNCSH